MTINSDENRLKTVIPYDELLDRVKVLATDISRDFKGKQLVLVATLKGSFIFVADLIRELKIPAHVDFVSVSSYIGTTPQEKVSLHYGPLHDVKGKHVVVVEDIIDTGETIKVAVDALRKKGALEVKVCSLIKRKHSTDDVLTPEYIGFKVDSGFVVGYGLDYNENYRNLKGIFELPEN